MSNQEDCDVVYNMFLKNLKDALGSEEINTNVMKLALDFLKMYNVKEEEVRESESLESFIKDLPFK